MLIITNHYLIQIQLQVELGLQQWNEQLLVGVELPLPQIQAEAGLDTRGGSLEIPTVDAPG